MNFRILYISANGFPESATDGRGAFSLEHAAALQVEGAEVHAVDTGSDRFARGEVGGVEIERMPRVRRMLRGFDLGALRRYAARVLAFRRARYDAVIFSFLYLKYLPLLLLLKARGTTVLFIAHGGEVMPGGAVRRALKRFVFDRADVVTPVSDFTATLLSCLVNRQDRDDGKIVTIPNGVHWAKLQPRLGRSAMRAKLGLPEEAFVVLSICNLVPRKGIAMLVDANLQLVAGGIDLHHVIVGRGPQRAELEATIAAAGQQARFHFVERVEVADLADYYAMADVFSMISKTGWSDNQTEGFGITLAEAMALGIPVVGGAGSGASTPVKHGFNGLLVDPHAPDVVDQVAAAIGKMAADPAARRAMGDMACRHAREEFDWGRNARQTLAVLARLRQGAPDKP